MSMPNPNPTDYTPSDAHLGGQRISTSYLAVWNRCPLEWFLDYVCPHPRVTESAGLRNITAATPLNAGRVWHEGLFAYRLTAWRDGVDTHEFDIDKALLYMDTKAKESRKDWESPEEYDKQTSRMRLLLEKYHQERIAEQTTILSDSEGQPILEREFQIPITDPRLERDYVYTVKIDALMSSERGDHQIGEYKSTSYRGLSAQMKGIHLSAQTHAELAVLHLAYPEAPLNGIRYEFAIKDRGKTSSEPTFIPWPAQTTPEALDSYLECVTQWLMQIEAALARWNALQQQGMDPYRAGTAAFTANGRSNGQCVRYYRLCDFASFCERLDLPGHMTLSGFVPKIVAGELYKPTANEEMPEIEVDV